jgi:hypothetical protein
MQPHGGSLRGRAGFCGPVGDLQGAGGPTWPGRLGCPRVRRPAGLPVMGQGRGRREEGEGEGLKCKKQK